MIVAEQKKKMKRCPVSMQPDIENLLNDLSPEDFSKASGRRTDVYNLLIAIVIAVIIVLAMNLVGSLLISALVILP